MRDIEKGREAFALATRWCLGFVHGSVRLRQRA